MNPHVARIALLLVLVGAFALTFGSTPAGASSSSGSNNGEVPGADTPVTGGEAAREVVELWAYAADQERAAYAAAHPDPSQALREYRRAKTCGVDTEGSDAAPDFSTEPCPRTAPVVPPDCGDDDPVEPLWVRERATPTSTWGPWQRISGWACPTDLLPALTAADFRRLPLAAPALAVQPDRGWVLVNKPTIVYSAATTQTLRTVLLGHPVTVVATPTTWTWDYGDGTATTTTSPGHPFPHQDVTHAYTDLGQRQITLTVTWTGTYRYDDLATAPRPVDGTATTTATTAPFTVEERRAHLVATTCDQDPNAPGC